MAVNKQGSRFHFYLLLLGIAFGASLGLYWLKQNTTGSKNILPAASPDYSKNGLNQPDWSGYSQLGRVLPKFRWSLPNLSPKMASNWKLPAYETSEFDRQVEEIRRIFGEEESFRSANLARSVRNYQSRLHQKLTARLNEHSASLTAAFDRDVRAKKEELEQELLKYQQELGAEYQTSLANLNLRLSVSDLTANGKPLDASETKKQLEMELEQMHRVMTAKIATRESELQAELNAFRTKRRAEVDATLNAEKAAGEADILAQVEQYRSGLEMNLADWSAKRQQEIEHAIALRQEDQAVITGSAGTISGSVGMNGTLIP